MSNSTDFAKSELKRIEDTCTDKESLEMQQRMTKHIVSMIEEFAKEGHSGFSASYAINILERLLRWLPLSPLTGEDDEWNDMSTMSKDPTWQNKRCSSVFKGADGRAYNIEGKIFSDDGGETWFTNKDSKVYIEKFPYSVPTHPEKVLVEKEKEEE